MERPTADPDRPELLSMLFNRTGVHDAVDWLSIRVQGQRMDVQGESLA